MKNYIQILFFLISINSFSQETIKCTTTLNPDEIEAYKNHQASIKNTHDIFYRTTNTDTETTGLIVLKTKIHVIQKSDGTNDHVLDASDIETYIQAVNDIYGEFNVFFDYCGSENINYINNDTYYEEIISYGTSEANMTDDHNQDDAVNIYYAPHVTNSTGSVLCGYSTYPFQQESGRNWTVINYNSQYTCATNGSTLAHELGHYLNLLHTHDTALGVENVTRDATDTCYNCDTAGDELCDTPADPNLTGFTANSGTNCTYTGTETDNCGEAGIEYEPDVTNLMSYSTRVCRNFFSEGQIQRMLDCIANDRTNIASNCYECQEQLDIPNTVLSGTIDEKSAASFIEAYNTIESNATAIYHAGEEVLLTDGFVAESGSAFDGYIEGCEIVTASKYYNETSVSDTSISVPDSVIEVDLSVFPNPSTGLFTVQSTEQVISYSISNITGSQIISNDKLNNSEFTIDLTQFSNGIYFLEIQKENGDVIKEKIIKN